MGINGASTRAALQDRARAWTVLIACGVAGCSLEIDDAVLGQGQSLLSHPIPAPETVPVGRVGGEFSVDEDGHATYMIDLPVPPGRNGLAPRLSLNYSSARGHSVLGRGWGLSGLSRIERCYRQRAALPTSVIGGLVAEDRFCLDGNELVQTGSNPDGTEYRTIPDTHVEVTRLSSGAAHWRVRASDGNVLFYGGSATSRIHFPTSSAFDSTIAWEVSRMEDRFGNFISYTYSHTFTIPDQGPSALEHYLTEIGYTGFASEAPLRKVVFAYQARSEINDSFRRGLRLRLGKRMSSITVISPDGTGTVRAVRRFDLGYAIAPSGRTLLSSLTDCALVGGAATPVCKPPARFEYTQDHDELHAQSDIEAAETEWDGFLVGPQLFANIDGVPGDERVWGQAEEGLDPETAEETAVVWFQRYRGTDRVPHPTSLLNTSHNNRGFWLYDMDDDGDDDIVRAEFVSGGWRFIYWSFNPSTDDFDGPFPSGPIVSPSPFMVNFQDANGDGYRDFFSCGPEVDDDPLAVDVFVWRVRHFLPAIKEFSEYRQTAFRCPDPGRFSAPIGVDPISFLQGGRVGSLALPGGSRVLAPLLLDTTGDNVPEWLHFYNDSVAGVSGTKSPGVYSLSGTRIADLPFDPTTVHAMSLGDFNGDASTDLLVFRNPVLVGHCGGGGPCARQEHEAVPDVALNQGNGVFGAPQPWGMAAVRLQEFRSAVVKDLDQDGRHDVIVAIRNPGETPVFASDPLSVKWIFARSLGRTFVEGGRVNVGPVTLGLRERSSDAPPMYPPDIRFPFSLDGNADSLRETLWWDDVKLSYFARERRFATDLLRRVEEGSLHPAMPPAAALPERDWALVIEYGPLNDDESYSLTRPRSACGPAAGAPECLEILRSRVRRSVVRVAREEDGVYTHAADEPATEVRYSYENGRFDRYGQGFLGFEVVRRFSLGLAEVTEYEPTTAAFQQWFPRARRPVRIERSFYGLVDAATGAPDSTSLEGSETTEYSYTEHVLGNPGLNERFFTSVSAVTQNRHADGALVYSESLDRTVDSWGNLTEMTRSIGTDRTDTITATYETFPNTFQHHFPKQRTIRSCVADVGTLRCRRRDDVFTYKSISASGDMALESQSTTPDGDPSQTESWAFEHDNRGNLRRAIQNGSREWRLTYDTAERFAPVSIENPLHQVAQVGIHPVFGVAWGQQDPNGVLWLRSLDGFGRVIDEHVVGQRFARTRFEDGTVFPNRFTVSSDGAETLERFDALGRVREQAVRRRLDGDWVRRTYTYEPQLGLLQRYSSARSSGSSPEVVLHYRDPSVPIPPGRLAARGLGRLRLTNFPDGSTAEMEFNGLETTSTDRDGNKRTETRDVGGRLREVLDPAVNGVRTRTRYGYGPFDTIRRVEDHDGNVTLLNVDGFARTVGFDDPDRGTRQFAYNAFGEMWRETHLESSQVTTYTFDALSRPLERVDSGPAIGVAEHSTWTWDSAPFGVGHLAGSLSPDGTQDSFEYDATGQLLSEEVSTAGVGPLRTEVALRDSHGRETWRRLPDGPGGASVYQWIEYDDFGYVERVGYGLDCTPVFGGASIACDTTEELWRAAASDAAGRLELELFGNDVSTARDYENETDRLSEIVTAPLGGGPILHFMQRYTDGGDVTHRSAMVDVAGTYRTEHDTYDALHRLTSTTIRDGDIDDSAAPVLSIQQFAYDPLGNLSFRSDVGSYGYDGTLPHALTSAGSGYPTGSFEYDPFGNQTRRGVEARDFDPRGRIIAIERPGIDRHEFQYSAAGNRVATRTVRESGSELLVVRAGIGYERIDESTLGAHTTTHVYRFHVEGRAIAQLEWGDDAEPPTVLFLHTDTLGSIAGATDSAGGLVERHAYDPTGMPRAPDWISPRPSDEFSRMPGFTGHRAHGEAEAGLIHMGARMYDPTLGVFISPDPFIDISFSQSLNSYGYALNNPLRFVDPLGLQAQCPSGGYCAEGSVDPDNGGVASAWFFTTSDPDFLSYMPNHPVTGARPRSVTVEFSIESETVVPDESTVPPADAALTRVREEVNSWCFNNPLQCSQDRFLRSPFGRFIREMEAGFWNLVDFATMYVVGQIPWLGEFLDLTILVDPESTTLERIGAVGSIAMSALTGTAGTNLSQGRVPRGAPGARAQASHPAFNVHGNSATSTARQHGYEIVDTWTGEVVKTGVSGAPLNRSGTSPRANSQVNRWNREPGNANRYEARVVVETLPGPDPRAWILSWESDHSDWLRSQGQLRDPTRHQRP
jgi:RHS repeat-associated protein